MNSRGACELYNVSWGTDNCEYSYKLTTSNIGKFCLDCCIESKLNPYFMGW
jgi:hypothetical protein